MMLYERSVQEPVVLPGSASPPGMTNSKSSKSSSFNSSLSDRETILTDPSNFEDIGLEDDACIHQSKRDPSPYDTSYASEIRAKTVTSKSKTQPHTPSLSKPRTTQITQREITMAKRQHSAPSLQPNALRSNVRSTNTGSLLSESYVNHLPLRKGPNSRPSVPSSGRRPRTPSPKLRQLPSNLSPNPRDPGMSLQLRRSSSWQSTRERRSEAELERECDEDDGDDIPDGFVLDNVPLSPRPPSERPKSQPPSKSNSPERSPKPRVRSVGNGTPAGGGESGSIGALRSPPLKSDTALSALRSPVSDSGLRSPLKTRVHSWNAALHGLNRDAQELTEKLEEHAEELELKAQRSSTGSMPMARRASTSQVAKPKHKSAFAELPPLRRSNVMIDPLPISKEKEAVLSRTRPSWLPPKDPAEERRHLREYQKMMQRSIENERRREEQKKAMSKNKDTAADSLMHIWEKEIIPRWNDSIRERRTRELWWRGIATRSRGEVWTRAIGNDLGLTENSFNAALKRAHEAEAREKAGHGSAEDHKVVGWTRAIRKDVEEQTWRDLRIFQAGGPLHQGLMDVLSAYAMYRSDIGYVTGCNTIAALLLINLPSPTAAFIALANILNRSLPLSFYSDDAGAKCSAYNLLLQTLATKSPKLHSHLTKLPDHDPDTYLGYIYNSLFTGHLALDEASRLWDVYVFEGDSVLVRAGVAVLLDHEMALLGTQSIEEVRTAISGKKQKLMGKPGDEQRWMKSVREAGKHNN